MHCFSSISMEVFWVHEPILAGEALPAEVAAAAALGSAGWSLTSPSPVPAQLLGFSCCQGQLSKLQPSLLLNKMFEERKYSPLWSQYSGDALAR